MSIHEQRVALRMSEACQAKLKRIKLKDYTGMKCKFEHGLWDADAQMHVSDAIFSRCDYNETMTALDFLTGRLFTYEGNEGWWKCGFISDPEYKRRTGIITFHVFNDLRDVFTKSTKRYREFESDKAPVLPTEYSLRFHMLISGQVYPRLLYMLPSPRDPYSRKR